MSQIHRGLKVEDAEINENTLIPYTRFIHPNHPGVHDLLKVTLHRCLSINRAYTGKSAQLNSHETGTFTPTQTKFDVQSHILNDTSRTEEKT